MATPIHRRGSVDWSFGVNNGESATGPEGLEVTEFSGDREYSTQMDRVDDTGALVDVLIGAEIQKVSVSGNGGTSLVTFDALDADTLSHPVAGLGTIFPVKVSGGQSNEDFTKVTFEGAGSPDL